MEELTKLCYNRLKVEEGWVEQVIVYCLLVLYVDTERVWQGRLPQSLLDNGCIEELGGKQDFYKLTEKGTEYIEGLSPVYLVDCLLSITCTPNRLIQEFISTLGLEKLAGLLVHEDPDVRLLARNRFEKLKEALSEDEEYRLILFYILGEGFIFERYSNSSLDSLARKGFVNFDYYTLITESGKQRVQRMPPVSVILYLSSGILEWARRFRPDPSIGVEYIKELVSKVSIEELPVLLSNDNEEIRKLAKERYEELRDGRVD